MKKDNKEQYISAQASQVVFVQHDNHTMALPDEKQSLINRI